MFDCTTELGTISTKISEISDAINDSSLENTIVLNNINDTLQQILALYQEEYNSIKAQQKLSKALTNNALNTSGQIQQIKDEYNNPSSTPW